MRVVPELVFLNCCHLAALDAKTVLAPFDRAEFAATIAEALIEADCVDEFATATSRTALGEDGLSALGPKLRAALAERFTRISTEDLGADELTLFERLR